MTGSADNDPVILVDADDVQVGTAGKLDAHRRGLKHRAISVLVRNAKGEFLLQRRSFAKYHSGGLWTNACFSHPLDDPCQGRGVDLAVLGERCDRDGDDRPECLPHRFQGRDHRGYAVPPAARAIQPRFCRGQRP